MGQRIKHSNVDASNYEASIGQLTLGEGDARAARHLKRYAVAVTLGSGASGTVKLANSEDLDAMVAIKVVNTKALDPRGIDMQRVRNEIQGWCFRPNVIFMECVCVLVWLLSVLKNGADACLPCHLCRVVAGP